MTPDELRAWCLSLLGAEETFPFTPGLSVFKVGGKVFAISGLADAPLQVSVKIEPEIGETLRATHASVVPGYHLNKRHWVTVTLGGDLEDQRVRELVEDSYDLVKPKRARSR
jgi:predicted DNA-binding protein (MmcQ/YjbR family)